jgi:hypothetical protein
MRFPFAIRWIDDCRTRRTVLLLGIIWMLGTFDLYFTLWAFQFTSFDEMNPWASQLLRHHELASMGLTKLLLVMVSTVAFWIVRKHRITELALWGLAVVHVGLIFRWAAYTSNALEMWAYCPSTPSVLMHEPVRPGLLPQIQLAQVHDSPVFNAAHTAQAPQASGAPAALFLENSPQNWPKPRT